MRDWLSEADTKGRILFVCADLSGNNMMRSINLIRILRKKYKIQVFGFAGAGKIFSPIEGILDLPIISIKREKHLRQTLIEELKHLFYIYRNFDLFYVRRLTWFTILPLFFIKILSQKPLILDVEDWDLGMLFDGNKDTFSKAMYSFFEILRFIADVVITGSRFLCRRFGGIYLPTPVDTDLFNPNKYTVDRFRLRRIYKLTDDDVLISFIGTIKKPKGVCDLLDAVKIANVPLKGKIKVFLVGRAIPELTDDLKQRIENMKEVYHINEFIPYIDVPRMLSATDIVVIPSKMTRNTNAQIPTKLFEAMAMAKPVIASNVSDFKEILHGCGVIVPPGDIKALATAICKLATNEGLREKNGLTARAKCVKQYSYVQAKVKLLDVLRNLKVH